MVEKRPDDHGVQGGLPPVEGLDGAAVRIACDESGFSGTNLLDPATPALTHASVDLSIEEAVSLIDTLRSGFRFSLEEFKSGQLMRGGRSDDGRSDDAWSWLTELGGRAHVFWVDKRFLLATRVVDLFLVEPSYAAGTRLTAAQRADALALHRGGPRAGAAWEEFLAAFVELVRTKRRHHPDRRIVKHFFRARDALTAAGLGDEAGMVLERLSRTRVREVSDRLAREDRSIPPPLEPMLPALAETVLFWSDGHRQVLVTHDEQSALTASRLRLLQQVLTTPSGPPPLAGLVMVDSRDDPRVQVADLLAGVARRSRGADAVGLLAPFLSPTSLRDPGLPASP